MIADDKVTRLRVNLCYLRLIIVSGVLVPAEQSTAPEEESFLQDQAVLSLGPPNPEHLLFSLNPPSNIHSASLYPRVHMYFHTLTLIPPPTRPPAR